jgi:hypothetical protein
LTQSQACPFYNGNVCFRRKPQGDFRDRALLPLISAAGWKVSSPLSRGKAERADVEVAKLSSSYDLIMACFYMLRRLGAFTRFPDDGRVCMTNTLIATNL